LNSLPLRLPLAAFLLFSAVVLLAQSAFPQNNPSKKNARPAASAESEKEPAVKDFVPVYTYVFTNPKFLISDVRVEHDEKGVGRLTFRKKDYEEDVVEPLQLSEWTLGRVKDLWERTGFLASTEEYQSPERDYSHLGTMKLEMSLDGSHRTVEFNWTENSLVKELADEYRKVGNQAIWAFDINVARQNQPLECPRVMKTLESYLRRDGISDPVQLLPFLRELKDDERMPLIARNNAERLISTIEKQYKDRVAGK